MVRILPVAAALLLGTWPSHVSGMSSDVTGAQAVDEAWRRAIVSNDLDAIVACYSSDAVMWLPGAPSARGQEAIRQAYAALLSLNTVKDAAFTEAHYETRGELSVGWGEFSLTITPKVGGNPIKMDGRFSVVATEMNGQWAYLLDHASAKPSVNDDVQQPGRLGNPVNESFPQGGALTATVQAPEKPVSITADIKPPERTVFVPPEYPANARRHGTEGRVVMEIVVDEKGRVENERVVESNPIFDDAAVKAVSRWKYKPALKEGRPVRVYLTVIVDFNLK